MSYVGTILWDENVCIADLEAFGASKPHRRWS